MGGNVRQASRTNEYNGAKSCAVAASLYVGETGCAYGCLGFGDCVAACAFDAIRMNPETGLPEVDPDKCTACGACVKACPKKVIELRKKWPKNRAVYVSCVSKDKGAVAMKACKAGCIGCGKCEKECAFGAITVENNLAYIDPPKCTLCRKGVNVCPTESLKMEPLGSVKDVESKNWDFAMTLSNKGDLVDKTTVKGSQFQPPLIQFNGACAGCGETQYVKMLTQLFGSKMILADAMGCSMVWSGTSGLIPFTVDKNGYGPVWCSSLFEDHA